MDKAHQRAGVAGVAGQAEHDTRARRRIGAGVVVIVQWGAEVLRERRQAVVAHAELLGARLGERAREHQRGHLAAGGDARRVQRGGVELGVVRYQRQLTHKVDQFVDALAHPGSVGDVLGADTVDGHVAWLEEVVLLGRLAQPGDAVDLLAVDDLDQADLADRAPVGVRRFHVEADKAQPRNTGGTPAGFNRVYLGSLALTRQLEQVDQLVDRVRRAGGKPQHQRVLGIATQRALDAVLAHPIACVNAHLGDVLDRNAALGAVAGKGGEQGRGADHHLGVRHRYQGTVGSNHVENSPITGASTYRR